MCSTILQFKNGSNRKEGHNLFYGELPNFIQRQGCSPWGCMYGSDRSQMMASRRKGSFNEDNSGANSTWHSFLNAPN